jgi:hypothetical protein
MRQGGEVDIVRVRVMTTPRLLADLITAALEVPQILAWEPGDSPAEVTITNTRGSLTDSRVTIVLGDCLDDPISVIVDGQRSEIAPLQLDGLHDLVLELAQAMPAIDSNRAHLGSTGVSGA